MSFVFSSSLMLLALWCFYVLCIFIFFDVACIMVLLCPLYFHLICCCLHYSAFMSFAFSSYLLLLALQCFNALCIFILFSVACITVLLCPLHFHLICCCLCDGAFMSFAFPFYLMLLALRCFYALCIFIFFDVACITVLLCPLYFHLL